MKIFNQKKGNLDDLSFALKVWISVGILFVLTGFIFTSMNDEVQNFTGGVGFNNESKLFFNTYDSNMNLALDWSFGLLVIGMIGISLILASRVKTSPVFLAIAIIYIIVIWTVASFFASFWDSFAVGNTDLAAYIVTLSVIPFILNHLMPLILVYTLLLAITLYLKEQ